MSTSRTALCSFVLFLFSSVPSALAQSVFLVPPTYPTGNFPVGVISADFNRDGSPDLASVDYFDNAVGVLLNNGDGTFAAYVSYPVGNGPEGMAASDFNGDGIPDLVVVNSADGTVSILLGNGDGTFRTQVPYSAGASVGWVVTGDLNGDNIPDLVVTNQSFAAPATVSVLLGVGDGTFQPAVAYPAGTGAYQAAVADFNGDGKLDVSVGNCTGAASSVSLLLGNGDGSLQAPISYSMTGDCAVVAAGDFNHDGKADLAAVSGDPDGTINIFLASPTGGFQPPILYQGGVNPDAVTVADLNADGKLDMVVADNSAEIVSVFFGKGDGTFQPGNGYGIGYSSFGLAVADYNRDGLPDIATANITLNGLSILLNTPANSFQGYVGCLGVFDSYVFAVGDVNHDGFPDAAVASAYENSVGVCLNQGGRTFQNALTVNAGLKPSTVAIGDFNGDGNGDLIVTNSDSGASVAVLLSNGNGTFQNPIDTALGSSNWTFGTSQPFALGDFNQDGKLDALLASNGVYPPQMLLGNGDGTFRILSSSVFGIILAAGDLNGDGKLDVVSLNYQQGPNTFLGNGDGTFRSVGTYSNCAGSNYGYPIGINVIDLNHDGKPDVVAAFDVYNGGSYTGCASVFLGNGDGTLQTPVTYQITSEGLSATVADFDGDGNADLAFASSTLELLLGNGDGTFQPAVGYPASGSWVTGSDVNADGFTDAVLASGEGYFQVLLSLGEPPAVDLSATRLNFEDQLVQTPSVPRSITLTNTGKGPLKITGITASESFFQTNTCGSLVASKASCVIKVRFLPRKPGRTPGSVTISDNAPNAPQTIKLLGYGTVVQLTPAELNFGTERVGHTSPPATVTLTNQGTLPLSISGLSILGEDAADFLVAGETCGSSVPPGSSCTLSITFTPTARGKRHAQVSVDDNGGGSPQQVQLQGTGS